MKGIEKTMKQKMLLVFIVFLVLFVGIVIQLLRITMVEGQNYEREVLVNAASKIGDSKKLNYKRGQIVDRNGIVLADSLIKYEVIYDAKLLLDEISLENQQKTISFLAENFAYTEIELKQILEDNPNNHNYILGSDYVYLDIAKLEDKIKSREVRGVFIRENYERYYPYKEHASDVIGFVNSDQIGFYGIEKTYDEYLIGKEGRSYSSVNDEQGVGRAEVESKDGYNVMLTIDYTVQRYLEEGIEKFLETEKAKEIHIIVMNPNNGEILGLANYPNFDLQTPYSLSKYFSEEEIASMSDEEVVAYLTDLWNNDVVKDTYEPGSTFKPFVYAAAKEEHKINEATRVTCHGTIQVADTLIHCWKNGGHGVQTAEEALKNSCNPGFVQIGENLGRDLYYKYQHSFGFGSVTNVDLIGETSGRDLLHPYDHLNPVELATSSFGQTFNITPIQLITGFSSLINGGYLYEPHVMKKIYDEKTGRLVEVYNETLVRQTISEDTSLATKLSLKGVVDEGTGRKAKIAGYEIGGKTGTAEKLPRIEDKYIVSFIGFAPVENPEVIALVVVDEPEGENVNSRYATALFSQVMENIMPYLQIFKVEE